MWILFNILDSSGFLCNVENRLIYVADCVSIKKFSEVSNGHNFSHTNRRKTILAPFGSPLRELSNGAKNVNIGFLLKALRAGRAKSISRPIVSASLSALVFTCLLCRPPYYHMPISQRL